VGGLVFVVVDPVTLYVVRKVPVVEIEGVQEQTIAAFLRYVYTDEVEIDLGTHPP
jgi:hypothetical protein